MRGRSGGRGQWRSEAGSDVGFGRRVQDSFERDTTMLRRFSAVPCVLSFVFVAAGVAPASSFLDLMPMTGSYYQAYPTGVNSSGAVSMQGYTAAYSSYYHVYLYTGGTAGTMNDISSKFVGSAADRTSAMNASGQIVGSLGYNNSGVADLYSGGLSGTTTVLPIPPGCSNKLAPLGIDNAGEAGGATEPSSGSPQYTAAVYSGGSAYLVDQPPQTGSPLHTNESWIDAMSPNGAYAGGQWLYYNNPPSGPFTAYACYWTPKSGSWTNGGTFNDISAAIYTALYSSSGGYYPSLALAGNNSGQILCSVGGLIGTGGANACIYQVGGGVTLLGSTFMVGPVVGPETFTQDAGMQQAINASGQVAGFEVVGGVDHAAIWQGGTITDLNTQYAGILPTGFVMNTALAIDDNGDIAGYGTDGSSHTVQAYVILNPVPEPSVLLLAATGLVGLSAYAWRKRK